MYCFIGRRGLSNQQIPENTDTILISGHSRIQALNSLRKLKIDDYLCKSFALFCRNDWVHGKQVQKRFADEWMRGATTMSGLVGGHGPHLMKLRSKVLAPIPSFDKIAEALKDACPSRPRQPAKAR